MSSVSIPEGAHKMRVVMLSKAALDSDTITEYEAVVIHIVPTTEEQRHVLLGLVAHLVGVPDMHFIALREIHDLGVPTDDDIDLAKRNADAARAILPITPSNSTVH